MRAALYVRVSTEDQHLDHQEHELRAECARRGWEVAGVYAEKVSGAAGKKRPELARLCHDASMRRFGAVLVWSISRLGRSTVDVLRMAEDWKARGVGLASLREPALDTTSHMGKFILTIWAAIAELELAQIRERTRAGMVGARRRGSRVGRPPKVDPAKVAHLAALGPSSGKATPAWLARQLGVSVRTAQRALAAHARAKKGAPE